MIGVDADFTEGSKKQVAEIKFLIHDLRVERFINNVILFHVNLNAELEIYNIEQAFELHTDDLTVLKLKAREMRRAFRDYSNAVTNFSPDKTILVTGRKYVETVHEICDLILNPLWGRFDRVLSFLPEESRSLQARNHYRNNIRWICGVYYRIEYFFQELKEVDVRDEFDVGHEITDFTNNVIHGYVVEKSRSRVEIQIDRQDTAVVLANRPRFRRMYFNLIMNAVDALTERPVGMIKIRVFTADGKVSIVVEDNGAGMYPEKVNHLMREPVTLDGELHSLGFVFVRQTVNQLGGTLHIDSTVGKGTAITIQFPYQLGKEPPPRPKSKCQQYAVMPFEGRDDGGTIVIVETAQGEPPSAARRRPEALPDDKASTSLDFDANDIQGQCGRIIHNDYLTSDADFRGCIFAIAVDYNNRVETFAHRPYEQTYAINHEDLNPMLYDATIRGRLEDNEAKVAELILKEPHSIAAYFDLKEIKDQRSGERYVEMIHDEYILIARKLLATGLPREIRVHVTSASKYLPDFEATLGPEPFALDQLAELPLGLNNP